MEHKWWIEYNPVVLLVMRPVLRMLGTDKHPLRGGVAAAIASGVAHYAIALFILWQDSLILSFINIPIIIYVLWGIVILSNLLIGVYRYMRGEYGDRPHKA